MDIFGLGFARTLVSIVEDVAERKKARAQVPPGQRKPDAGARSGTTLAAPPKAGLRQKLQELAKKASVPKLGKVGIRSQKMTPLTHGESETPSPEQQRPVSGSTTGTVKRFKALFKKKKKTEQPQQSLVPATTEEKPSPSGMMNNLLRRAGLRSRQPRALDRAAMQALDMAMRRDLAAVSRDRSEESDTAPAGRLQAAAKRILQSGYAAGQADLKGFVDSLEGTAAVRVLLQYGEPKAVNAFMQRVVNANELSGEQIAGLLSAGNAAESVRTEGEIEMETERPKDDPPLKFLFEQWSPDRALHVRDFIGNILQSGRLTADQKFRLLTGANPDGAAHVHRLFMDRSNGLAKGYLDAIFDQHRHRFTLQELRTIAKHIVDACLHAERDNPMDFNGTWRAVFARTIRTMESTAAMKELLRDALEREALRGFKSGKGGIAWNIPSWQEQGFTASGSGTTTATHENLHTHAGEETTQLPEDAIGVRVKKGGIAWDIVFERIGTSAIDGSMAEEGGIATNIVVPGSNAASTSRNNALKEDIAPNSKLDDYDLPSIRHPESAPHDGYDADTEYSNRKTKREQKALLPKGYEADGESSGDEPSGRRQHRIGIRAAMPLLANGQAGHAQGFIDEGLRRADDEVRVLNHDMDAFAETGTQVRQIVLKLFERVQRLEQRLNLPGSGNAGETRGTAYPPYDALATIRHEQRVLSLTPGENARINELVRRFHAHEDSGNWPERVGTFLKSTEDEIRHNAIGLLDNPLPNVWKPSKADRVVLSSMLGTTEGREALYSELAYEAGEPGNGPLQKSKGAILQILLDEANGSDRPDIQSVPRSIEDIGRRIRDLRRAYARSELRSTGEVFLKELRIRLEAARSNGPDGAGVAGTASSRWADIQANTHAPANLDAMTFRLQEILDGLATDRNDVAAGHDAMIGFMNRARELEKDLDQLETVAMHAPNRDMLAQTLTNTWQKQQVLSLTPGENSRINELVYQFYAGENSGDWSAHVNEFLNDTYSEMEVRSVSTLDNPLSDAWLPSRAEIEALLPRLRTSEGRTALREELDGEVVVLNDEPRQVARNEILSILLDEMDDANGPGTQSVPQSDEDIKRRIVDLRQANARLELRHQRGQFIDELRARIEAAHRPGN